MTEHYEANKENEEKEKGKKKVRNVISIRLSGNIDFSGLLVLHIITGLN